MAPRFVPVEPSATEATVAWLQREGHPPPDLRAEVARLAAALDQARADLAAERTAHAATRADRDTLAKAVAELHVNRHAPRLMARIEALFAAHLASEGRS